MRRPVNLVAFAFKEPTLASIAEVLSLCGDFQAGAGVCTYLRSKFLRICGCKRRRDAMESVPRPWPSGDIMRRLVIKSSTYASAVLRSAGEEYFSPADRRDQVLRCSSSSAPPLDSASFAGLDKLYMQILLCCPESQIPLPRCILGYAMLHRRSISIPE